MACNSDKRKGFWIPYDVPEKVFAGKLTRAFDTFRIIKIHCGKAFNRIPKGLRRYHLDELISLGWLKYVEATKTYHQVSTEKIFPRVTGTKRHWHSIEDLEKDVRAVLFDMDHHYLKGTFLRSEASHNRRESGSVEKTRKKMPSKDSRHHGELALSIFMLRYNCSIGYASKLRRLVESEGLGKFTERFRLTKWDTALEGYVWGDPDHLFDGYGGAWCQITSAYVCFQPREMSIDMGRDWKGYTRKRKKVDQREISNFCTGGGYAH